jgi:hypothetical protein
MVLNTLAGKMEASIAMKQATLISSERPVTILRLTISTRMVRQLQNLTGEAAALILIEGCEGFAKRHQLNIGASFFCAVQDAQKLKFRVQLWSKVNLLLSFTARKLKTCSGVHRIPLYAFLQPIAAKSDKITIGIRG